MRVRCWGLLGCVIALLAAPVFGGCGDDGGEESASAGFGYGAEDGPERWAELDPAHSACDEGRRQSPIDLVDGRPAAPPPLSFSYQPAELRVDNNGHSLEAEYPPGSALRSGGEQYELRQFHFHAPSEHRIGGEAWPLEFHLVHESPAGELLVLGVMVEEGRPNPAAARLVEALPEREGEGLAVDGDVDALDLLPPRPAAATRWSYPGSLTTPPCTEGVAWVVYDDPVEFSAEQIAAFTSIYEGTNRPVQPLNGRTPRVGA